MFLLAPVRMTSVDRHKQSLSQMVCAGKSIQIVIVIVLNVISRLKSEFVFRKTFSCQMTFHVSILDIPSLCCITGNRINYAVNTTFITSDCKSKCVCTHDAYLACIPLCPKAILKCPVGFKQQIVNTPVANLNQVCYCPKYECVPISIPGPGRYHHQLPSWTKTMTLQSIIACNNLMIT